MSVFHLSGSTHEVMAKCIRKLWWGEAQGKRRTHWISWNKFTKSKGDGGLGFRDFKLFNQALLARQAWRLIDRPESLCARVLKAKYFPNGHLMDTAFPCNQSQTWKAIVHGLELLKRGVLWRIGSGERVRIWRDSWIPRSWSLKPIGKKSSCRLKWVCQLIDPTSMEWKVELIKHVFWEHDAEQILGVKLPSKPREDVLAWHHDRKGLFSVKRAYRLAMALDEEEKGGRQSSSTNSCERSCWKAFWKIPIPHKILIFGWRAINNGLATQSNKNRRGIAISSSCEVCGMETKSIMHACSRQVLTCRGTPQAEGLS